MGRNDNTGKYQGKPLLPYMPTMVPQAPAAKPAVAAAPTPAPPSAPLYNIVPVFNAPVRTVAQPLRQGQPTRRALLQRLEQTAE